MKNYLFVLIFFTNFCNAQLNNSVWVFGDSAGIDFTVPNNPVPINSALRSRGTAVSISDSSGNLLFYGGTFATLPGNTGEIWDASHHIMLNGDSIVGAGWYHEMIIVPMPSNSEKFFVFSIGVTGSFHYGLYYSIVDMSQNAGLGAVSVKNVQLSSLAALDALAAVKHGNGRDWWLIFKPEGYQNPPNNQFFVYLITPDSVIAYPEQLVGSIIYTNIGNLTFSKAGDKLLLTDGDNLIEMYNFDRCTGYLSNPVTIEPESLGQPREHVGSCFSASGDIIYVVNIPYFPSDTVYYLYQYDLLAGNIAASRDTIYTGYHPELTVTIRLAPDDKVYMSTWYDCGGFCFPYPDSIRNSINENLSVINYPDSLGTDCDFQPYSFYLGGKRTYAGLPNNPDYTMASMSGSSCDTIDVGIKHPHANTKFDVFYHSEWKKSFINATGIINGEYALSVVDLLGQTIYREFGNVHGNSFTKSLDCSMLKAGLYIVSFQSGGKILSKKIMIQ